MREARSGMRIRHFAAVLVFLTVGGGEVWATTPGTCFGIVDVGAGDSLNLRAGPHASARIIRSFDGNSAVVIAKIGPCNRWCRVGVHTGDGSFKGWMFGRYLEPRECP